MDFNERFFSILLRIGDRKAFEIKIAMEKKALRKKNNAVYFIT